MYCVAHCLVVTQKTLNWINFAVHLKLYSIVDQLYFDLNKAAWDQLLHKALDMRSLYLIPSIKSH